MYTMWNVQGENVKEKLSDYEEAYKLTHVGQRKGRELYELDLETYEQYKALDDLIKSLGLDLTIRINAEWLAVLYTNSDDFGVDRNKENGVI